MKKPLNAIQIARLFHIGVKDAQALIKRAVEVRMGEKPVPVQKRVKKVLPDFAMKFGGAKSIKPIDKKLAGKAYRFWRRVQAGKV